jgi:uncharacterized SAM-binding protein YcdF (DUF218 family)
MMKEEKDAKYDAILIPGGGIKNKNDVPLWVRRRLDRVIEVYQGEYIIALSAGTTHKPPPLDTNGFPIFESVVSVNYLKEKGIDPQKILFETCSYDTIGNAYFSRVIHVEPRGFRKLLIVTSSFHMSRTRTVFQWVYGMESPSSPNTYDLYYEEVPDDGMDEHMLKARIEKEKKSLKHLCHLKNKIRTFKQFHQWLFTEHGAYAAAVEPGRIKGKILDTY